MKNSSKPARREQIIRRINFLEKQLENLNHYLPQTYELLMVELDSQRCELAQLDIQRAYTDIDHQEQPTSTDKAPARSE